MRVLQVVPGISPAYGGPSVALTSLARALTDFGTDTTMLTTNASPGSRLNVPLNEEISRQGARYMFHNVIALGGRYGFAPRLIDTLVRTIRSYDIVHIHWLFNFSCIATALAASRAGVPFVVQPNASLDPYLRRKNQFIKNAYLKTFGRPLLTRAAAMIFTSEQERLLADYGQRRDEWIVPVGLDAKTFNDLPAPGTFRRAFPEVKGPFLLFLGRLSRQKGLDLLVESFSAIAAERPELDLVIAGPDAEGHGADIRALVQKAGLAGRVHMTGMLSHEMKLAAFVDARLFVLPSYAENFGAVITESLASGLPVLISNRVNIYQEIVGGGAGIAVDCTADAVADGIRRALDDPARLARMAAAGRELVRQRYTWDVIVPELVERYQGVIKREPARVPRRSVPAAAVNGNGNGSSPAPAGVHLAPDRPLRILHVISSISPEKGGPSKAVVELSRTLAERGHDVTLLTTDLPNAPESMLNEVAKEIAPVRLRWFRATTPRGWGFSQALGRALWSDVRGYDVVHIHSLYMFHTLAASMACRRAGVPYIIRPHGTLDPFLLRRGRLKKSAYTALIEKRNLDHAAAIHYTSDEEKRLAHGMIGIQAPPVVVPLGVDMKEFQNLPDPEEFHRRFPETRGKRIVLFLSRLNFKKGLDVLVAAFARLNDPSLHLVLAGPADEGFGELVEGWVAEHHIEARTTFTGMLVKREKLAALSAASVFVLPSYTESFGFAVVEALAAGVPTIMSDQVHIAHEIREAGAAIVSACNPEDVAAQIRRVLDDPELAAELRRNGPRLVQDRFTWSHVVDALLPVYRDVINRSGALS